MLTEQKYLALERAAEFKSEYFDGEILPRSGASLRHARLQCNILCELHNALRDAPCEPLGFDLRVHAPSRMHAYPDLSVACRKPLLADHHEDVLLNPVVIVEVLSPSTETYDRGRKFKHYRTITTLQDYILVNQAEIRIEHYTRQANNRWILRDYQSLDEEMTIISIGVSLPLRRVYDRVEFDPEHY
jgi:Uma2 family endonuclease